MRRKILSIITVVHANFDGLRALFETIRPLLNDDVEWIIKDSGKCSKTKTFFGNFSNANVRFYSCDDNGIYDALNFALLRCTSKYYIVVGSDDAIFPQEFSAVSSTLKSSYNSNSIITAPVLINGVKHTPSYYKPTCYSVGGLISSHSVGTFIPRQLHDTLGFYDTNFNILADSKFIRLACMKKVNFRALNTDAIGEFSTEGVSSTAVLERIHEAYRYNVDLGSSRFLQYFFFTVRMALYFRRKYFLRWYSFLKTKF